MDTRTATSRRAPLPSLTAEPADLLVVGGGITGAGIARDAAMRGLRTVLVEQGDLASGTSSISSRLVHGGLRYLEQGNLRLVFEASHERRVLLSIAPHLVRPLPFVFPVHKGDRVPLWKLAAGMWIYDLLAMFRNVRRHRLLGKRGLLRLEPMLRERGLVGGALYYDAQCDDARLTVATARSAVHHGARVATYTCVESLALADGRVQGAHLRDVLGGETGTVRARVVVNATGPWTDGLRRMEDPHAAAILRPTKGVHVVVRRDRVGNRHAVTITSPMDGRVMFVLPWGDLAYIGTTDTDWEGRPEDVRATHEDIVYLLRSANAYFPHARLTEEDVLATWAGLRPLVADPGAAEASDVSREHVILRGSHGMITIAGGKLTTYRAMAAEVVDRVVSDLHAVDGRPVPAPAPTDREPLPGGETAEIEPLRQAGMDLGLAAATVDHVLRLFGTEAAAVYNLARGDQSWRRPIHPAHPAVVAEIVHCVRRELAETVADVLTRRLHLSYETADHAVAVSEKVATVMARELRWGPDRVAREVAAYRAAWERGQVP